MTDSAPARSRRHAAPSTSSPVAVPAAILTLALALRVALVLATKAHYLARYDASDYVRLGHEVSAGKDMTTLTPIFHAGYSAFRPPLYPVLLGAVIKLGGGITAMRLTGAVLGTISVALFGLLAAELWSRRVGLVAMVIAAVYPSFILLDSVLYSEVLFLPFLLASLYLAARAVRQQSWRWALASGVAVGLAAEVRPNGFLVAVPVIVLVAARWPAGWRKSVVPVAGVIVATVLVMTPWTIRNEVRLHAFIPSTDASGFDLSGTFNAQDAHDGQYPGTFIPGFAVEEYVPLFTDPTLDEPALNAALGRKARDYALHHPKYVGKVAVANSARMFGVSKPSWDQTEAGLMNIGRNTGLAWYYGWWLLIALGLVVSPWAWRRRAPAALLLLPLVFWLPSALTASGDPRYREPIEVAVVLLVASGLAAATTRRATP